jgi:hypothetical protein
MKGKFSWFEWTAVLAALVLAACGGGGGGDNDGGGAPGDVTPPAIVSTLPIDGAAGVSQTTAVTATFSEAVAPASFTASTFSLSAGALPVGGTLTVSGAVATFNPVVPLALDTLFTARLDTGVTDLAGNALTAPFVWDFTTEAAPWSGTKQLGTTAVDTGNAVAVDGSGNVYVAGSTDDDLDGVGVGDPALGGRDFVLVKFAPDGTLLWSRQLGTVATDEANAVAVDGAGNVYVAGNTSGDLDGAGIGDPLFGGDDFFLVKFDPAGSLLFTRQLGTVATDEGNAVAVDGSGNIYVAGNTSGDLDGTGGDPLVGGVDFFLAKFDPAGSQLFTRQLGTVATDEANALAVDGTGSVYVAGNTSGDLDGVGFGGVDFFLAKFDPAGSQLFTRQLGTAPTDQANGVAVDGAGNVYVSGNTSGVLNGVGFGGVDFFLTKLDPSGRLLFTRQLGTVATDSSFGVAVGVLAVGGNVFVAGETLGDLDGNPSAGNFDLFLTKFDPFGNLQ